MVDKGKLVGPAKRTELPEPLEFFADSKEQIEQSVDGMRPQLEKTFREAIERSKGTGLPSERITAGFDVR